MTYLDTHHPTDRREDVRVDVGCRMRVFRDGRSRTVRLRNMSCRGALAEYGQPSSPAMLHRAALDTGTGRTIYLLARTVWVDGEHQGLRFMGLRDVDRLAIAEFIDQNMSARQVA